MNIFMVGWIQCLESAHRHFTAQSSTAEFPTLPDVPRTYIRQRDPLQAKLTLVLHHSTVWAGSCGCRILFAQMAKSRPTRGERCCKHRGKRRKMPQGRIANQHE